MRNRAAGMAVVLGLLSLATLPVAVAGTRWSKDYDLLHAAFAIPLAALLGFVAMGLGGRARLRVERTLGRAGGRASARIGRLLGLAGVLVALTAAGAVGVYGILTLVAAD